MKIDNLTPRQVALEIAIDWLKQAYHFRTGDLDELTPAQRAAVRLEIKRLYVKLAEQANLEATPLPE